MEYKKFLSARLFIIFNKGVNYRWLLDRIRGISPSVLDLRGFIMKVYKVLCSYERFLCSIITLNIKRF